MGLQAVLAGIGGGHRYVDHFAGQRIEGSAKPAAV
jgi:hypothetical protein